MGVLFIERLDGMFKDFKFPVLSDWQLYIEGELLVDPFNRDCVQSVGVDLHLGDLFAIPSSSVIEMGNATSYRFIDDSEYKLPAGGFCLGYTKEVIKMPPYFMGRIEPVSSNVRVGLNVIGGIVDAGYTGNLTLGLSNLTEQFIKLQGDETICRLIISRCNETTRPYCGKYQNSEKIVGAR